MSILSPNYLHSHASPCCFLLVGRLFFLAIVLNPTGVHHRLGENRAELYKYEQ